MSDVNSMPKQGSAGSGHKINHPAKCWQRAIGPLESGYNQGKVYEVYARNVSHGSLFGFVEVDELVFGERSTVVLDPSEERIKAEFAGVKRSYLPLQSVLRIDEVRKQGTSKITTLEGSNVTPFPAPLFAAPGGDSGPKK